MNDNNAQGSQLPHNEQTDMIFEDAQGVHANALDNNGYTEHEQMNSPAAVRYNHFLVRHFEAHRHIFYSSRSQGMRSIVRSGREVQTNKTHRKGRVWGRLVRSKTTFVIQPVCDTELPYICA